MKTEPTPDPPSAKERREWADGIVYHATADGGLLYYDYVQGRWLTSSSTPESAARPTRVHPIPSKS